MCYNMIVSVEAVLPYTPKITYLEKENSPCLTLLMLTLVSVAVHAQTAAPLALSLKKTANM